MQNNGYCVCHQHNDCIQYMYVTRVLHGLAAGAHVETQAAPTDHHEDAPGPCATGGENLHRQVRTPP